MNGRSDGAVALAKAACGARQELQWTDDVRPDHERDEPAQSEHAADGDQDAPAQTLDRRIDLGYRTRHQHRPAQLPNGVVADKLVAGAKIVPALFRAVPSGQRFLHFGRGEERLATRDQVLLRMRDHDAVTVHEDPRGRDAVGDLAHQSLDVVEGECSTDHRSQLTAGTKHRRRDDDGGIPRSGDEDVGHPGGLVLDDGAEVVSPRAISADDPGHEGGVRGFRSQHHTGRAQQEETSEVRVHPGESLEHLADELVIATLDGCPEPRTARSFDDGSPGAVDVRLDQLREIRRRDVLGHKDLAVEDVSGRGVREDSKDGDGDRRGEQEDRRVFDLDRQVSIRRPPGHSPGFRPAA